VVELWRAGCHESVTILAPRRKVGEALAAPHGHHVGIAGVMRHPRLDVTESVAMRHVQRGNAKQSSHLQCRAVPDVEIVVDEDGADGAPPVQRLDALHELEDLRDVLSRAPPQGIRNALGHPFENGPRGHDLAGRNSGGGDPGGVDSLGRVHFLQSARLHGEGLRRGQAVLEENEIVFAASRHPLEQVLAGIQTASQDQVPVAHDRPAL